MLYLSYYLLCFLSNKTVEQQGRTGSAWKRGGVGGMKENGGCWGLGGEVTQAMYTHINKCKNNKKLNKYIQEKM
jgi:hypothetical protein